MAKDQGKPLTPFMTRQRIWLLVVFLLLVGWAALNYTHNHRIYAILILAFFLVSLLLPKPSFTLVLISIIAFVFINTVSFSALSQIRSNIGKLVEHPKEPLTEIFTPRSGLGVLTEQVQQMLAMIDAYHLASYRLSPTVGEGEDNHTVQRIVESAWPVRMDNASKNVFIDPAETQAYAACKLIDQAKDVVLVNCE